MTSAGLGRRLANSWRDKHYPNQKLDAASLIYTKAPQIIRAFDEGAVIRSRRGRFSRYRAACRRGHQTPWKIDNVVRRRIATHVGVRRSRRPPSWLRWTADGEQHPLLATDARHYQMLIPG